jgi:hypothetical protein
MVAETSDTTQFKVAIIRKQSDTGSPSETEVQCTEEESADETEVQSKEVASEETSIDLGQWVVVT